MQGRLGVVLEGQISLVGYDLNPAGDLWLPNFAHVTLFWQAERDDLEDLEVAVRLRDAEGVVQAQVKGRPVDGYYPTPQWLAGELVRDQHSFWLAEDFRPGRYAVEVSVFGAQCGKPPSPVEGRVSEDGWIFLTQVEVRKP